MNRPEKIGFYASGALHLAVIVLAITGTEWLRPTPQTPEVISQVAVMSEQDFNAMMASAPKDAPQPTPDPKAPIAPTPPNESAPPETPAPEAQAQPEPKPDALADPAAQADAKPDVSNIQEPPAQADVSDTPPVMAPPVEVPSDTVSPEISPQPKPKQVPRVAPTPAPEPPPDAQVSETAKPAETPKPEATPQPVPDKPKQAEAPPEATSEIATEANKTDTPETSAPQASPRPASKPNPPAPGPGGTGSAPTGPPITAGEKDALIVDVKRCWNVGALSSDALRTTVTLSVQMQPDGHPIISSIKLVGSSGGSGSAVDQAFEAGKRAIVRCGADGFPLPPEKYARWKTIEIDFNPDKMRMK
ncbi:energy transducer TonB [Thioclava dalianensis]|uniref:Energy transducer TonB n=1 Tax=Thioclava dalianensis TaxID=1185766 RepID=A0A074T9C9_9RHOB|nr:hypothetical protein [Thioclava dalianensis]KEP68269.1 energy transducer TonB [Thioclava dalianensis]